MSTETGRRAGVLEIDATVLLSLFGDGQRMRYRVTEGIPADARIIGARYDAARDVWEVAFESEMLPVCPAFEMYPRYRPTVIDERERVE